MQVGRIGSEAKGQGSYASRRLAIENLEERAVPAGLALAELIQVELGRSNLGIIGEGATPNTGGTGYTFRLSTIPTAPVTITLVADDSRIFLGQHEGNSFTLTPSQTSEYIDFLAAEDNEVTGTVAASVDVILSSQDPRFNGVLDDRVGFTVIDNDYLVTSTADSGPGSLRQAVSEVQNWGANPTIRFAENLSGQTIRLERHLSSSKSLNIDASGLPAGVTIAPDSDDANIRFFETSGGLTLKNLTLRGFTSDSHGGAIFATGWRLQVFDSVFEGNEANWGGAIAVLRGTAEIVNTRFGGESEAAGNRTLCFGGGAIYIDAQASATIRNSTFNGNTAITDGGAIWNAGSLVAENTNFLANRAEDSGGAIANFGKLRSTGNTLAGNSSESGGGIYLSKGEAYLVNSTISGNSARRDGGGVRIEGGIAGIVSSTIAGNLATVSGGGISSQGSPVTTLQNSIVAGNRAGSAAAQAASDLAGVAPATSYSLISDPASALGLQHGESGNIVGQADGSGGRKLLPVDEILFPLADNGGPTPTHALRPASPAINQGQLSPLPYWPHATLVFDQRGTGFSRVFGGSMDIGAVELQPNRPPTINAPEAYFARPGQLDLFAILVTDVDGAAQSLSISLEGEDAEAFSLSPNGMLSFNAPPQPAAPSDRDGDNRYHIEITATDVSGAVTSRQITVTVLGPDPWQNFDSPTDVNNDNYITAQDALIIINELNLRLHSDSVTGALRTLASGQGPSFYLDVSGDGYLTALDALMVINQLHWMTTLPPSDSSSETLLAAEPIPDELQQSGEGWSDNAQQNAGSEPASELSADTYAAAEWFYSLSNREPKKSPTWPIV